MGKIIDLTNQKFGYLTVIKKTNKRGADRSVIWHCKCECGNECDISSTNLRNGNTKSCGCYMKKRISETHLKMIPKGTQVGRLTVLEMLEERNQSGLVMYKCQCKCGNICKIAGRDLKKEKPTSSCGCLRKEIFQQNVDKNEIGKKYGKLTVINISSNQNQYKQHYLICQCECGSIIEVTLNHLHSGHTKSCGCSNSKGEDKITEILQNNNINFIKQKTFQDCKDKKALPFDFYINNSYLIEYDGIQHFKPIKYFGGEEDFKIRKKHDQLKTKYCKDHNIPIIRIPYTHLDNLCLNDLIPETSKFLVE